MTEERFIRRLDSRFPHIIIVGNYISSNIKTKFRCKIHNDDFENKPHYIITSKSGGCKYCSLEYISKNKNHYRLGPVKKTNEQFLLEIEKNFDGKYKPLEEYIGTKYKIKFYCNIHNIEFIQTPQNLFLGTTCPICSKENQKNKLKKSSSLNIEDVQEQINKKHKDLYTYIDGYTGKDELANFYCNKHEINFSSIVSNMLRSKSCPECKKETFSHNNDNMKISFKEAQNRIDNIHFGNIQLIEFISTNKKAKFKCLIHNLEGSKIYRSLLDSKGCKQCSMSKGELFISKYLIANNYNFNSQIKFEGFKNITYYYFDFGVYKDESKTKLLFLIEFDGTDHYELQNRSKSWNEEEKLRRLKHRQNSDLIKWNYCQDNNIPLLIIPYWIKDLTKIKIFSERVRG